MFNKQYLDKLSSIVEQFQNHAEIITQAIHPVLEQAGRHQGLLDQITLPDNIFSLSNTVIDYQKQIRPAIEIALHQSQIIQQTLSSFQLDYFDQINRISDILAKVIVPSDILKNIAQTWKNWDKAVEHEVFEICKKYHYFISPSTPKEFRNYLFDVYKKNRQKKIVEKEFYKIYKKNNWNVLNFYKQWEGNKFLKKRRLVIKDIISYVRNTKNPSPRVVLPVVISQINGILLDIALCNGISIKEITKNNTEKSKPEKKIREEIIMFLKSNSNEIQSEIAFNMIESVLFQDVWIGENSKRGTYNFSRHKIMHGEDAKGLTKSNMIRAFLLLDFLAQFLINDKK